MGQANGHVGAQLEERYFLQKVKLGQGSFGTVWRAVDRHKGSTVAIKQLDKASLPRRGVSRHDIEREISMMKACCHENITELFDTFEDDKSIYLALEYCDGGDFGDKVKERGMAATEEEVAEWMRQMCAAIQAMHMKEICHRDVKPDNFMCQGTKLKLSDFGLAIFLPKGKLLQEKCGTPAFMSPEQHHLPKRSAGYSFPADMWAVGVSMYMMMFGGKHPFLNDRGGLDETLLTTGELDFRDSSSNRGFFGGLAGLGGANLRFSDQARSLCKRMVEPEPQKRINADETANVKWLQIGREVTSAGLVVPAPNPGAGTAGARAMTPPVAQVSDHDRDAERRPATPRTTPPPRRASAEAAANGPAVKTKVEPREESRLGGAKERALTPGPEGRKALEQAAKLKEQNLALLSEVEERKKREEELVKQQSRWLELQMKFAKQKTTELEELKREKSQQEKQLQEMASEKEELQRQKDKVLQASSSSRSKLLQKGTKCRYESGTYGWIAAEVQSYNESNGTYNLDVRQHAALDKIAPIGDVAAKEAWPPGTHAFYHSSTANNWLPVVVTSFNEHDGTYNLDVRDHADIDRIRARVDRPGSDAAGHAEPRRSATSGCRDDNSPDNAPAPSVGSRHDGKKSTQRVDSDAKRTAHKGEVEATAAAGVPSASSTAAPAHWVGRGDACIHPEHGMAYIESVGKDGVFTVKVNTKKVPQLHQVSAEVIRAPGESKFSWKAGTKVSYLSNSVGKWIDANVVSFDASNSTYTLDVRPGAAPDKVRPRTLAA